MTFIEVFKDSNNALLPWSNTPFIGSSSVHFDHSDDPGVYEFISECLSECQTSHPNCKSPDAVPLPKRLLEVSEPNRTCRLVEPTQDQRGTYTALSYCWGTGNPLKLIQELYHFYKNGIPWDKLPQLFQDAMRITNRLGVSNIWIDSLCIIQDSQEDWEVEAEKMASIYQNAHVTIVAGSSPNPETPILRERDLDITKAEFNFIEKNGLESYLFSRLVHEDMFDSYHIEAKQISSRRWKETLYQRGWTFQEDLLSRRTIHYLSNRIVWECRMLHCDERQLPQDRRQALDRSDLTPWTWWEFVEAYAVRDLTCISDKLPAMSGIANMMSQKTGDDYLGGLWRSSLITDLAWSSYMNWYGREKPTYIPPREYIAPSWSWASIAKPSRITNFEANVARDRICATVIDASVTLKGHNRFGEVSDGFVQLRGPVREVKLHYPDRYGIFKHCFPACELAEQRIDILIMLDMEICVGDGLMETGEKVPTMCRRYAEDEANDPMPGKNAYPAVHIIFLLDTEFGNVSGLVLGRSPRVPGAYERLGVVGLKTNELKQAKKLAVESTITIV
ncbi:hypothetical protein MW887_000242 [Aspergillus wentii]|nr:hypothetical protein MW887_000242 [Aspergillus wentii]